MGDFVLARVPERYGTFWGADGRAYKAGEVAPMTQRMLRAYGVTPEPMTAPVQPSPPAMVDGGVSSLKAPRGRKV